MNLLIDMGSIMEYLEYPLGLRTDTNQCYCALCLLASTFHRSHSTFYLVKFLLVHFFVDGILFDVQGRHWSALPIRLSQDGFEANLDFVMSLFSCYSLPTLFQILGISEDQNLKKYFHQNGKQGKIYFFTICILANPPHKDNYRWIHIIIETTHDPGWILLLDNFSSGGLLLYFIHEPIHQPIVMVE